MSRSVKIADKVVDGLAFDVIECYVGDDAEKGIKGERVEYELPTTADSFKAMVAAATATKLSDIWERYNYGHGLKARASGRPDGGGATLPTTMTKKRGTLDLVTGIFDGLIGAKDKKVPAPVPWTGEPIPLKLRLDIINATLHEASVREETPGRAFLLARETHLANKTAVLDKAGALVPAPAPR